MTDGSTALPARLAALAAFLPVFAAPGFRFGDSVVPLAAADGTLSFPYYELSASATAFVAACYANRWVRPEIDWMAWQDSADGRRLQTSRAALAGATADDLAALLTALIRGERFSDGRLAAAFASGLLTAILERAAALRAATDRP